MNGPLALVVERDRALRALIAEVLQDEELSPVVVSSFAEAADALRERSFDVVLADPIDPATEISELLRLRFVAEPPPAVLAIAAGPGPGPGLEGTGGGAVELVLQPVDAPRLRRAVRRALRQRLGRLREELRTRTAPLGLVGGSACIVALRERLERLAGGDSSVWFSGEAGSGRELSARTLHALSDRAAGPFVVVRGGQLKGVDGLAERARGGVLYLADVASIPRAVQARLREIVGPAAGFRVCCSSTASAGSAVEHGRLSPELGALLAREVVPVPPLSDRVEDIPLLARHFVRAVCSMNLLPPAPVAPETLELLQAHGWPENVRELRNVLEQAVIVSPDGTIQPRDLPEPLRRLERPRPAGARVGATRGFREAKREIVDRFEHAYLGELMARHGGNVTAAARQARMLRSALQRLLRKHGLRSAEFRPPARHETAGLAQPPS